MKKDNFQGMADKELSETIETYVSVLREALDEQNSRKKAKVEAAREEYNAARDKLNQLSPFDRAQMLYYHPWATQLRKTIWI